MEIKKNNVIARDYVEKNYIHKDKIRKIFEKNEDKICGNDLYLGGTQSLELTLLRKVEKELLGDEN